MEDPEDTPGREMLDQSSPGGFRGQHHVEKVAGMVTVLGHMGEPYALLGSPILKFRLVALPDLDSSDLDCVPGLELGK